MLFRSPGSSATVTNSGDEKNAIFDFVIPKGDTGASALPPEFLTAYSTPAHPGTSGGALVFDKNGVTFGNAVTHTEGSTDFTLNETGYYCVSFHGTIASVKNTKFPVSILIYLQQQGTLVPGAAVSHIFHTSLENENIAFTQIIQVSGVPNTIRIIGEGENFLYAEIGIVIKKIGNL